jgi:nitrogen fixation protein FixH
MCIRWTIVKQRGLVAYNGVAIARRNPCLNRYLLKSLGWHLELNISVLTQDEQVPVEARIATRDGHTIVGDKATLFYYRPSDAHFDGQVELSRDRDGVFTGSLKLPLKGKWDVVLEIHKGEDTYQLGRSLWVQQKDTPNTAAETGK